MTLVLKKGHLELGEYLKKGKKKQEIFFSTYICHPSMANDNIASTALLIEIINYLKKTYSKSKYSYRFVFYFRNNWINKLFIKKI